MMRRARWCRLPSVVGLAVLGILAAGCHNAQTRGQAEEEPEGDRYEIKTVGKVASVINTEPVTVGGVGLVTGLSGTGSSPPPGDYRTMLEHALLTRGVRDPKKVLSSPDVSLVLVSAAVPAGARKGDTLDVEVTLPPGSRTTSLRGGHLEECFLYNYDLASNLPHRPEFQGDRFLLGHKLVKAEGSLLVGFGDGDEAAKVRQGRIWGGGQCLLDRPFVLILNDKYNYTRIASLVADRINETFHGRSLRGPGTEIAVAMPQNPDASRPRDEDPSGPSRSHLLVNLAVPEQYRHNKERYLRIICMIPMTEAPSDKDKAHKPPYRQRLAEDLLDPAHTITAALRLEALGKDSMPVLKRGLESDRPLVRFAAAEALAYLGSPSCGEELARAVANYPDLRVYGLTALASLDEAVSRVKLRELLTSADAETRYGAFRALRALDERDPVVQGEQLNESFWLHRVAANSEPLVHLSTSKRAEIVLFGDEAFLKVPFQIAAGEFTLTAGDGDEQCVVARFSPEYGVSRRPCPLRVEDVVRALAEEGAGYPEVVEVLRQARSCDRVSCRIENDALPQATSVYALARAGKEKAGVLGVDPDLAQSDKDIRDARADLGATPSLFSKDGVRRSRQALEQEEEALVRDRKAPDSKRRADGAKIGD